MVLSGGKRAKREADSASNSKKDDASSIGPSSLKENAGHSNVVGNATNNDLLPPPKDGPKDHPCRFCDKTFEKSQALGGHMNKHRAEKEEEGLRKARSLVESKKQVLFGNNPQWPNYGRGGGAGNQSQQYGQNLSSNAHYGGTSTTPQSYNPNLNQSASIQQNQMQMNQSVLVPQQQIQMHGHQGGVNIIRGTHLGPPSQGVTAQHQAHQGTWVNNSGQMSYPGQHGGTDFHFQQQLNQQAGSSQLLGQDVMAQSSNVTMAYPQQFQQDHPTRGQLPQIHQSAQYYYEVQHPNTYGTFHPHVPQDGSQTSIDEKSESLRNQSVGTSDNRTPQHHILLQEGTDHNIADPVGECGAETPEDKVGDHAHGFQ